MIIAASLRKNRHRNFARQAVSNSAPNRFCTAFSSTCARRNISPFSVHKLLAAKHFSLWRLITRNFAIPSASLSRLVLAFGEFLSLVFSVPRAPSARGGWSLCASALVLIAFFSCVWCLSWSPCLAQQKVTGPPLSGTEPLTTEGDIAAQMVAGIDKFLLREIDLAVQR